jgi:hypothetical protein
MLWLAHEANSIVGISAKVKRRLIDNRVRDTLLGREQRASLGGPQHLLSFTSATIGSTWPAMPSRVASKLSGLHQPSRACQPCQRTIVEILVR